MTRKQDKSVLVLKMTTEIASAFPGFFHLIHLFKQQHRLEPGSLVGLLVMALAELEAEYKADASGDAALMEWLQVQIDDARKRRDEAEEPS